jgi:NADPH:quinone reductase-like Zn-dependent oxidoreductase
MRDPELSYAISGELLELTASGVLDPHVSGRYSLDEAGTALRLLMDRQARGKLVIAP